MRFGQVTLLYPHRALLKAAAGDPFEVEFVNAIIATGVKPAAPAAPGGGLARLITSAQLFDRVRPLRGLVVPGAGPAGVALAQIFAAFGVRVTVPEEDLRILEPAGEEIAHMPEARMLRQGGARVLDTHVSRVGHAGGGAFVQYRDQAGGAHQACGEYVLQVTRHEARTYGRTDDTSRTGDRTDPINVSPGRLRRRAASAVAASTGSQGSAPPPAGFPEPRDPGPVRSLRPRMAARISGAIITAVRTQCTRHWTTAFTPAFENTSGAVGVTVCWVPPSTGNPVLEIDTVGE